MIEQIYVSLILVGVTIGAVMAALWYKARRASMLNLALIRLNEQHGFDAPAFLDHAWPLLAGSTFRGLSWRLDWFGVLKEGQAGVARGHITEREIEVGEMKLALRFYRDEGRGEQRYFEEALMETILLLLRSDMLIKAGTTDATLAHMARLNLFLQHDMKNIAQFIQLMGDQLATVPSGREQKVLDYLRVATPMIRHRADRIVRTLTVGTAAPEFAQLASLAALVRQVCGLYQLRYAVTGDATVQAGGSCLETVLDNIFKNYQDIALRDGIRDMQLEIGIGEHDGVVEVTVRAPLATGATAPERLFEPFWSNKDDGLGIGLYQAQHLMRQHGGSLFATQDEAKVLCFHLHIPSQPSEVLSN